jgi:hypothetical protein
MGSFGLGKGCVRKHALLGIRKDGSSHVLRTATIGIVVVLGLLVVSGMGIVAAPYRMSLRRGD